MVRGPDIVTVANEAMKAKEFIEDNWIEGVHYLIVFGVTVIFKVPVYASVAHYFLHDIYDNLTHGGSGVEGIIEGPTVPSPVRPGRMEPGPHSTSVARQKFTRGFCIPAPRNRFCR